MDTSDAGVSDDPVADRTQRLMSLQRAVRAAIEQLAALLQRRRFSADPDSLPESDQQLTRALERISLRQDSLEELLLSGSATGTTVTDEGWPGEDRFDRESGWRISVADRLTQIEVALQTLLERIDSHVSSPAAQEGHVEASKSLTDNSVAPADPVQSVAVASKDFGWLSAILGKVLCEDPQLSDPISWLKEQVVDGNSAAQYFLGQVLVFREAIASRKPLVLKDLGEAYYRCFSTESGRFDRFEQAIANWVELHCIEAGLQNSIELVHVGDRFDGNRHTTASKGGVEIAEVLGWVVLREGGKVFAKALVKAR